MNDEIVSLLMALLETAGVEIYTARFANGGYTMVTIRALTTRVSSAKGTDAQALREALDRALENHHYQKMLLGVETP